MTAQTHHSLTHFCSARVNEACKLWLLEGLGAEGLSTVHFLITIDLRSHAVEKHLMEDYPEKIRFAIDHGLDTYNAQIVWELKDSQMARRYVCVISADLTEAVRNPEAFTRSIARNFGIVLDLAVGLSVS